MFNLKLLLDRNPEMWVVPSAHPKKKRKGRPYQQMKIRIRKIMTNSNKERGGRDGAECLGLCTPPHLVGAV